jgi:hypothetical protein
MVNVIGENSDDLVALLTKADQPSGCVIADHATA